MPDDARPKIERKEGVTIGAYKEKHINVEINSKIIKNIIAYEVYNKEDPPPALEEYKTKVLKGARDHNLSEEYIKELKKVLEKR